MSAKKRTDKEPLADVEIGAVAKMKAIRFDEVPETEVSFPGSDERRSGSHTERENLPDEIEPGVTYRDAKIRWRAEAAVRTEVSPELAEALDDETRTRTKLECQGKGPRRRCPSGCPAYARRPARAGWRGRGGDGGGRGDRDRGLPAASRRR